jgi:hypothetical protein
MQNFSNALQSETPQDFSRQFGGIWMPLAKLQHSFIVSFE